MRLARGFKALALAGAMALPVMGIPAVAVSQSAGLSGSVVAVVNDDIITSYDVEQRIRLLAVMSGVQPTQDSLPQLQAEAVSSLIDERLEMKALREIEVKQKVQIISTDREVDEQIAEVARLNGATPESLLTSLRSSGINPESYRAQIRAQSSWETWITGRFSSRVRIGEDQVKTYQREYNERQSKPQYEVSEVYIDAARVGGMEVAMNGASQLVAQLQQGAPFAAVARQFSSAPTAAKGGDAGWIAQGTMPANVEAALDQLRAGQISAPIQVEGGVYILYLRDKRAGASAAMVSLKQAAVGVARDAPAAEVEAARVKLANLRTKVTSCDVLDSAAASVDGVLTADLGETEVKDLAPAFRQAAETLQVGQVSEPIRTEAGLHLVALCGKRAAGAGPAPQPAQIENMLRGVQLANISRTELRNLHDSATIERR